MHATANDVTFYLWIQIHADPDPELATVNSLTLDPESAAQGVFAIESQSYMFVYNVYSPSGLQTEFHPGNQASVFALVLLAIALLLMMMAAVGSRQQACSNSPTPPTIPT